MDDFNRFNKVLMLTVIVISLVLVATSLYLDKPTGGDMTRVGGYSDNDYGWNKPLEIYEHPLYQRNNGDYHGYDDLLVLGDSFSSANPQMNWVNYFVDGTKLSAQVLHFDQGGVERFLNSPDFKQTPPKYLVIESIEASLYRRFSDRNCQIEWQQQPTVQHAELINNSNYQVKLKHRETHQPGLNLDNAGSYLAKAIPRWFGVNLTDTFRFPINRNDLFSSRIKDQILVHEGDIAKQDLPQDSVTTMACNLLRVQQQVESNGYTRMLVMVVPDKLTAYSRVLQDQSLAHLSIIPALAAHQPLNVIRLDQLMQQQIADGVVDLYLPNDTHWTSTGYRLAAEAMISYFNQLNQDGGVAKR